MNVTDPTSTGRLVCGHESTERCVLTPKHIENDQTGTGRSVTVDIKQRNTTLISECQDCHTHGKEAEHLRVQELAKKIETHPHRAAFHADLQQNNVYNPFSENSKEMIRELAMWSYSSWAKLHQKYNVLTVFFIGIKELCTAFVDNAGFKANREEIIKWLRLDAIFIQDYVIKERRYPWCSTRQDRGAKRIPLGLECVEEMLQESRLPRWTFYRYSRSISQRSSSSRNTTRNRMVRRKSAKSGMNLQKKTIHTNSLQRKREDTKNNGVLLRTKQAKMGLWSFDLIFEPLSQWKIVYTTNQENQLKNPSIQVNKDAYDKDKKFSPKVACPAFELINIQDGIIGLQLQVPHGGAHLNRVGSELTIFFNLLKSLLFV